MIRHATRTLIPALCLGLLAACGGGSGGGGADDDGGGPAVLVGHFVGPATAGLRYETATESGLTEADGAYRYQPGETIAFYVGDLLLGQAPAGSRTQLPDLVPGVTLPTDTQAARAIARESGNASHPDIHDQDRARFLQLLNRAILLQFLDEDGDPTNGIVVPPAIHDLAQGLTLDFSGGWRVFRNDLALRRLRRDALAAGLWGGEGRPVPLTSVVLDRLYEALGLTHTFMRTTETFRVTLTGPDTGDSHLERFTYTSLGFPRRAELDWLDGLGTDKTETNEYDEHGFQTAYVHVWTSGREATGLFEYDANGHRRRTVYGLNGTPRVVYQYAHDALGNVVRLSSDTDADGTTNSEETYTYNGHGLETEHVTHFDTDDDGTVDIVSRTTTEYDSGHRPARRLSNFRADGTPRVIETWTYESGVLRRHVRESDTTDDGVIDTTAETTYDEQGRRVLGIHVSPVGTFRDHVTYHPDGGVVDVRGEDAMGNFQNRSTTNPDGSTMFEQDNDRDGNLEVRWDARPDGFVTRYELDSDDDGVVEFTRISDRDSTSHRSEEYSADGTQLESVLLSEWDDQGRWTRTERQDGTGATTLLVTLQYEDLPGGGWVARKVNNGVESEERTVLRPGTWVEIIGGSQH